MLFWCILKSFHLDPLVSYFSKRGPRIELEPLGVEPRKLMFIKFPKVFTKVGESFSYTLKDTERERDGTPIKGVNPSWSRLTLGIFTGFETA